MKKFAKIALATFSALAVSLGEANVALAQSIPAGLWEMAYYNDQFCLDSGGNWYSLQQNGWNGYWSSPVRYEPQVRFEPAAMVGSTDPGVENDSIVITGKPGHYFARWNEWNSDYSWIGLVVVEWKYVSSSCTDARKYDWHKASRGTFPMRLHSDSANRVN